MSNLDRIACHNVRMRRNRNRELRVLGVYYGILCLLAAFLPQLLTSITPLHRLVVILSLLAGVIIGGAVSPSSFRHNPKLWNPARFRWLPKKWHPAYVRVCKHLGAVFGFFAVCCLLFAVHIT